MNRQPLRPGEGQFPADQIKIPVPPSRFQSSQDGVLRLPPTVPAALSYRQTIVRIWPQGVTAPAVDVVPSPGAESHSPSELFGPGQATVHIVSGTKAFGRLTTREEDADTLLGLRGRLDSEGWDWCPTVATSPDRQWVEGGALLRDGDPDEVMHLARFHGQSVMLRWDDAGMVMVPTRAGVDVADPTPVPVRLVPVATGCPLRGGADGVCKMYGGPWTSSSMSAALVWKNHRAMLLDAFGCDVCHGEGGGGAIGAVDLYTPSREGGWQWGPPRTREQMA